MIKMVMKARRNSFDFQAIEVSTVTEVASCDNVDPGRMK